MTQFHHLVPDEESKEEWTKALIAAEAGFASTSIEYGSRISTEPPFLAIFPRLRVAIFVSEIFTRFFNALKMLFLVLFTVLP